MDSAWVEAVNTFCDVTITGGVASPGGLASGTLVRRPFPPQAALVQHHDCVSDEVGALITASQHPAGAAPIVVRCDTGTSVRSLVAVLYLGTTLPPSHLQAA